MRGSTALTIALLLALSAPARAARLPGVGPPAQLYVPLDLRESTAFALTHAPLAEPAEWSRSPAWDAAHPPLPGTGIRSTVLTELRQLDPQTTALRARVPPEELRQALAECLQGPRWPARALAAAGVSVSLRIEQGVTLRFSHPVSVVPELLLGCSLQDAGTGTFVARGEGFQAQEGALGGEALLAGVSLVAEPAAGDLATGGEGGELLVAPWPDVLLLLPDAEARDADPLALREPDGLVRFQVELAPDLILAVRQKGRGAGTRVLLPPGIAPDRGGVVVLSSPPPLPELRSLPPDAPGLAVRTDPTDPLARDLAERIALLLRARGWSTLGPAEARILRWRPASRDPGLALLELASQLGLEGAGPGLLAGSRAERTALAFTLESRWLREGRVVPLLTAAHWCTVSARLRGVRLRGDGVPLLDDAYWSGP